MSQEYKTTYDMIESFKKQLKAQTCNIAKQKILKAISSLLEIQEELRAKELQDIKNR